jgi:hypothetical protein
LLSCRVPKIAKKKKKNFHRYIIKERTAKFEDITRFHLNTNARTHHAYLVTAMVSSHLRKVTGRKSAWKSVRNGGKRGELMRYRNVGG